MSILDAKKTKGISQKCVQLATTGLNWCQGDVRMNEEMPI